MQIVCLVAFAVFGFVSCDESPRFLRAQAASEAGVPEEHFTGDLTSMKETLQTALAKKGPKDPKTHLCCQIKGAKQGGAVGSFTYDCYTEDDEGEYCAEHYDPMVVSFDNSTMVILSSPPKMVAVPANAFGLEFWVVVIPLAVLAVVGWVLFFLTCCSDYKLVSSGDKEAAHEELKAVLETGSIAFDGGAHSLKKEGTETLDRIAEVLKRYPSVKIKIDGHTDGDNMQLSVNRVNTTKKYLEDQGVTNEMETQGWSDKHPEIKNKKLVRVYPL
uniref:OmpA-like domain-containing protein n=1 Tax=Chromera velia CCMP2878 TaxID=1169474 RepID=A0A0G4I9N1_9ALVE|eukprot:Cvel_12311.t1-p1 / transcript=Cvel_12311.t1 / gene=Cvel_12311 / organism=Chromera_velia_CCMP2878 / gene_product=hypothetical protein / transcript_product=hypothetical protein / location=Cvel_scaffold800:28305-29120(+) / protein_length=272 / sequence_SO=supercontig / SO=protein_coding / is_pseudo=false